MPDINILVVDDEKEIADLIEIYLVSDGYKAVSYTHLDVYKRQLSGRTASQFITHLLGRK